MFCMLMQVEKWANWRWTNQWWNDFEHNMIRYPTGLKIPFHDRESRLEEMHTSTFYNWSSVPTADKYTATLYVLGCHSGSRSVLLKFLAEMSKQKMKNGSFNGCKPLVERISQQVMAGGTPRMHFQTYLRSLTSGM